MTDRAAASATCWTRPPITLTYWGNWKRWGGNERRTSLASLTVKIFDDRRTSPTCYKTNPSNRFCHDLTTVLTFGSSFYRQWAIVSSERWQQQQQLWGRGNWGANSDCVTTSMVLVPEPFFRAPKIRILIQPSLVLVTNPKTWLRCCTLTA